MLWNDGIFRWMVLPEFMDQRWAFRCWVVDLNIRRRKSHQHAPCSDEFGMPWCVLSSIQVNLSEQGPPLLQDANDAPFAGLPYS